MNVIISGAGGFVGSHLTKALLKKCSLIYLFVKDKASVPFAAGLENVKIIECADAEPDAIIPHITEPVDIFYHLAWSGTSGELRHSDEVQLNNIKTACVMVRLCAALNVKRFVYVGSIMEFDVFDRPALDISGRNTTLYAVAKYTAHYMTEIMAEQYGMEYAAAVISNIYGPGEVSKRFVYSMLTRMLRSETIDLSSCEQPYDFIYISDAVDQIIAIAERGRDRAAYYVGNSAQKPLKDFVLTMREIAGGSAVLNFGRIACGINKAYYDKFDTTKVERELQVVPRISFPDGIAKTIDWIKSHEE